jgi:hypothetical protein
MAPLKKIFTIVAINVGRHYKWNMMKSDNDVLGDFTLKHAADFSP